MTLSKLIYSLLLSASLALAMPWSSSRAELEFLNDEALQDMDLAESNAREANLTADKEASREYREYEREQRREAKEKQKEQERESKDRD